MTGIVTSARKLRLRDADIENLTKAVAQLYGEVMTACRAADLANRNSSLIRARAVGPTGIVRQYIKWLGEPAQDWVDTATVKIFNMNAKCWDQFRKQWAHLEHADPITGRFSYA